MIDLIQARAKVADEKMRMVQAAVAIDFYNNRQRDYMQMVTAEIYPNTWRDIKNYIYASGITHQIVNETAVLFQVPPEFNIETENEAIKDKFNEVLQSSELWKKLIASDRMADLTGKIGLCPRWHTKDNRVVVDIITPDKCFVVQDPEDPTKAETVYYAVDRDTDPRLATPITIYAKWTRETYSEVQLNQDFKEIKTTKEATPNPYGQIPVVWIAPLIEVDSFWVDHGYPIIDGNISINLRESNLDMALDFQSFSTLVTSGMPDTKDIITGITRRIDLPAQEFGNNNPPDAKYITPDAKLEEVSRIINGKRVSLAQQSGLSESSFNRDTGTINSGYQLRLSKQDVIVYNNLKKEIYRKALIDLVKLMITCFNLNDKSFSFPDGLAIDLQYGNVVFDDNPVERVALQQQKIMSGMMSLPDAIRENNPSLTQQEAIDEAKRIRDEQAQISGIASISPADLGL